MNVTSAAGTVHAIAAGYHARSLCGTMTNTASKYRTNAAITCVDCVKIMMKAMTLHPDDVCEASLTCLRYAVEVQEHPTQGMIPVCALHSRVLEVEAEEAAEAAAEALISGK